MNKHVAVLGRIQTERREKTGQLFGQKADPDTIVGPTGGAALGQIHDVVELD